MNRALNETRTSSFMLVNQVSHSYNFVPHPCKKPSKLQNVLRRKQQTGNIHVCKNEINNSKNINLSVDLFILIYIYMYIYI